MALKEKNKWLSRLRELGGSIRQALWRPWLLCAIVACALLAGAWFGLRSAWRAFARRPEFALSPATLSFTDCPSSVKGEAMVLELRRQVAPALQGASVFDRNLCRRVHDALAASPWVLHVQSVQRRLPNKLRVQVVFRQPAGLVEAGGVSYMVDADGLWLPLRLFQPPEAWARVGVPAIVSGKLSGRPREGRSWDGVPGVAVGARLTLFLLDEGILRDLQIKKLDVTNVGRAGDDPDIVVVTAGGVNIKWGCSDAYDQLAGLSRPACESADSEKVRMLRTVLQRHPLFEGLQHIDLRFNKIFLLPSAPATGQQPSAGPARTVLTGRASSGSRTGPRKRGGQRF